MCQCYIWEWRWCNILQWFFFGQSTNHTIHRVGIESEFYGITFGGIHWNTHISSSSSSVGTFGRLSQLPGGISTNHKNLAVYWIRVRKCQMRIFNSTHAILYLIYIIFQCIKRLLDDTKNHWQSTLCIHPFKKQTSYIEIVRRWNAQNTLPTFYGVTHTMSNFFEEILYLSSKFIMVKMLYSHWKIDDLDFLRSQSGKSMSYLNCMTVIFYASYLIMR